MLMVPDWIGRDMFEAVIAGIAAKDPPKLLGDVRLQTHAEERCVQTLHIGSFASPSPRSETMPV